MSGDKIYNISNIENAHFVIQSADYQSLCSQIEDKKELLGYLPETEAKKRLKVSEELSQLEEQLRQFKESVIQLAETFSKIEINTERLRSAKKLFDKGEFREADAILKAEDIASDLNNIIEKEAQLQRQQVQLNQNREQIANEYLIKAQLWQTFYERPNRFEQTCEYFELAIKAWKTLENLFAYAYFLQEHNQILQAEPLYQEVLETYRNLAQDNPRTFLPYVATTLNNLANLHSDKNDYESAEGEYREALEIRRNLAQENPRTFLPDLAMTLVNLSIFYLQAIPNREKSLALATETIQIAEQFPQFPIVQQYAEAAKQVITANEAS